jgi:ferredoxin
VNIEVDMDLCDSHGQCVFAAPDVFSFDEDDYLGYDATPDDSRRAAVAKAVASCPVRAIRIVEG